MQMEDKIIHYTSDELIRVSVAVTRTITQKARTCHNLSPVASAALGRAMTGAVLLAGDYKNHEGVSLKFNGDGPLGAVHADCFDSHYVRGYVDHPQLDIPLKANGKLDVSGAVGQHGQLSVTRFTPEKMTYTSQAELVSGEIAEDLAYYLLTSEQVPSTISLGVLVARDYSIAASGGFLVQALPGARDEDLARVEANITCIGPITSYLSGHPDGEELAGIIEGKDLDIDLLEVDENEAALCSASAAGRGFAQSGGVANAVANKIKEWHPDMEVKIASAQGLADCKKLLMLAKAGKYNGYLLEGMGCPGGCIGGAGTIADPARTAIQLNKYMKEAPFTDPEQSPYMSEIHVLKDDPNFEL